MPVWDAKVYERYKTYRDRPALDLMERLPADLPAKEVWDLGCGTGEHAILLGARYREGHVHGLDSSPEMLAEAKLRGPDLDWRLGDIADFAPETPPDLIFTNAALQWVGDHQRLFPRLVGLLAPSGVFAWETSLKRPIRARRTNSRQAAPVRLSEDGGFEGAPRIHALRGAKAGSASQAPRQRRSARATTLASSDGARTLGRRAP